MGFIMSNQLTSIVQQDLANKNVQWRWLRSLLPFMHHLHVLSDKIDLFSKNSSVGSTLWIAYHMKIMTFGGTFCFKVFTRVSWCCFDLPKQDIPSPVYMHFGPASILIYPEMVLLQFVIEESETALVLVVPILLMHDTIIFHCFVILDVHHFSNRNIFIHEKWL